jgi:hypothetical protein
VALARGGTPELAAYQRYDGQLQLAASMGQLADIALALAQRPASDGATFASTSGATFGADAVLAVPRLLDCYADPA